MPGELMDISVEALKITPLILKKMQNELLSIDEESILNEWMERSEGNRQYMAMVTTTGIPRNHLETHTFYEKKKPAAKARIMEELFPGNVKPLKQRKRRMRRIFMAAAFILPLLVSFAVYWFSQSTDIPPGQYKATLQLADKQAIMVDSTQQGQLAIQGSAVVLGEGGQLIYSIRKPGTEEVLLNTLMTDTGQTYSTTLSDGTRIWLNAASSVTYPVVFTGKERRVTVTGEAYFEVARDTAKPFWVDIVTRPGEQAKRSIEVTGTHFNVHAYADESSVQATLLEGAIRVHANNRVLDIEPGQQAVLIGTIMQKKEVDSNKHTAWVRHYFRFKGDDIKAIMRQLARWYGVQVIYMGNVPSGSYSGTISRDKNISEVLKLLEVNGMSYKIKGKVITVMP